MTFAIIFLSIVGLIILISICKINAFLSFLMVSIGAGLMLGISAADITHSVEKGIGDTLGSLAIILCTGAMLGKLIAESGAAGQLSATITQIFGTKYIQWAMMLTGFIIGIPLYYGIGFVLMVPLIFSISHQHKLPAIYLGLPMLAALSVTHGFLPPHPSPSALVIQFGADMGLTLIYGMIVAIPAIIIAGPVFSRFLKNIPAYPMQAFTQSHAESSHFPGKTISLITALLPVILLLTGTFLPFILPKPLPAAVILFGQSSIVMIIALAFATYTLGFKAGLSIGRIMGIYTDAVKEVGMILLIIGGSGALKQVLTDSGASTEIAAALQHVSLPPLVLGWLIAAVIRASVGSATVAGLTTAGIVAPLILETHTNPNLMVLSVGAGSLMFSHVNDSGFWLFKEYFNVSVKDTLKTWSVMETLVGVAGLAGVLIINSIIKK